MSLHLIESRKVRSINSRKRGGALASVVLHAVLVASAVTLATAAPLPIAHPTEEPIVYVAPRPRDQAPASPTTAAPREQSNARQAPLPVVPAFPVDIPTTIPTVDYTASDDISLITTRTGARGADVADNVVGCCSAGASLAGIKTDLQVDKPVALIAGTRAPRYPDVLRAAGVQDTVLATFIVDTLGRIEPESFQALNAPNVLFIAAVRQSLLAARFKPAEVTGHPVRQRVNQAFVFSLLH
jgi:outer membrane biosynthesis protein TonB